MNARLTGGMAGAAMVLMLGATAGAQLVVQPGLDHWKQGEPAIVRFGPSSDVPPIPADFFGPGSLPFEGSVLFNGSAIDAAVSPADTIVQRSAPATLPLPGANTVPIEIVELRLRSVAPITVNTDSGPSQWDVTLELRPTPPSGGNAQLFRNFTGNTMAYQFQFSGVFRFRHVSGVPTLVRPVGPLNVVTAMSANWNELPPPGLQPPGAGPNLFANSPMHLSSSGSGLEMLLMPAGGADCNGNGIIDIADLNARVPTSFDANRNRVPDDCEAQVELLQLSFSNRGAGYTARFSDYGQVLVTGIEPEHGEVAWFNMAVNGAWSVQNLPMHELNGSGGVWTWAAMFNLGVPVGTPVNIASVQWQISTQPRNAPPAGLVTTVPVTETEVTFGERNGIPGAPALLPGPAPNFIVPPILIQWEIVARRDMPGVNEMVDGCAPGGAARSLAWMNDLYCLKFDAACDTAQELYDILKDAMHMMTAFPGGTSDPKIVSGIQRLINDKMLGGKLSVMIVYDPTPSAVFDALQAGKDVLGLIGWTGPNGGGHVITVTGATKCGNSVVIDYKDDASGGDKQGDGMADGDKSKSTPVTPTPGGGATLGNLPPNTWDGFVKICPTRLVQQQALHKWLNGDLGMGGVTDGVLGLGGDILGGTQPTFLDFVLLRIWACNALDTACFMKTQIDECGSDAAKAAALRIKMKALAGKLKILDYFYSEDPIDLFDALLEFDADFDADMEIVRMAIDCNNNGIDDKADIANGTSFDATGDMIPDECQCLADWNNSGTVSVQDIFDFLADYFSTGADFNHSGATSVQDIFDFLAAYFAGCG